MLRTFRREGKPAYLDPVRAFLVHAKPEEKVRQRLLQMLLREHGVPLNLLRVEHPVTTASRTTRLRADILVLDRSESPLMVIECKEPQTYLTDTVFEQARRYADELRCRYIARTNGTDLDCFERAGDGWVQLASFPSYAEMEPTAGRRRKRPKSRDFVPLTQRQLRDHAFLARHDRALANDWGYCVLGQDTPPSLWSPIFAMYAAVFHRPDHGQHLPHRYEGCAIEEYLGIHYSEYGNYSGGKFPGLYAAYRIKDAAGDDQIFKIGFFACAHTENDPKFGNRLGTSGIHVAIDDFDNAPHMSLELCLDTCLRVDGRQTRLLHDGKITVGRLGAAKRSVLLDYVSKRAPDLVRNDQVFLGSFPAGGVLTFGDVADTVFNLIRYSEIRDRFRKDYKRGTLT